MRPDRPSLLNRIKTALFRASTKFDTTYNSSCNEKNEIVISTYERLERERDTFLALVPDMEAR